MPRTFSPTEAAQLTATSKTFVRHTIEDGVFPTKTIAWKGNRRRLELPASALVYITILRELDGNAQLPRPVQRKLYRFIVHSEAERFEMGVISIQVGSVRRRVEKSVKRYNELTSRWIEQDPERFSGRPVIKGTELRVHNLAERIRKGDTMDILYEDYPYVPREAIDFAVEYAEANPMLGRPPRPPRKGRSIGEDRVLVEGLPMPVARR